MRSSDILFASSIVSFGDIKVTTSNCLLKIFIVSFWLETSWLIENEGYNIQSIERRPFEYDIVRWDNIHYSVLDFEENLPRGFSKSHSEKMVLIVGVYILLKPDMDPGVILSSFSSMPIYLKAFEKDDITWASYVDENFSHLEPDYICNVMTT